MKKSLLALAALSAFATAAQAQSSVTLYGSIDTGYSSVEGTVNTLARTNGTDGATTTTAATNVKTTNAGIANSSDVSSRWGIRGSEDLGGGMKANFNVETSLGSGTNGALNGNTTATGTTRAPAGWINTASIGNRAMWAGISTSGGLEVRGGLQNQFIRDVALSSAADGTTNVVGNLLAGNSSVFADRHNAISVVQTMGAVKVGAAMTGRSTEKDAVANVDTGKGYELMANYSAGKLALGAAYRKVDNTAVGISAADQATDFNKANGTNLAAGAFDAIAASGTETETTVISASYNFGPVKAFVGYGTQDVLNTVTATVGQKTEREVTTVGVNGNVNAKTQLFATYSTGETKAARAAGVAPALDMDGYVVGARYSLSKRTTAYAIYGESDVDATATASTAGAKLTGTKTKQMAFGLNHAF